MKALVIGGTGWVGSEIALAFEHAGYETEILTRGRKKEFAGRVGFLKSYTGDKTDPAFLQEIVVKGQYDVVIDSVPVPEVIEMLGKMPDEFGRYLHCGSTGVCTPLQYFPADENHPFATGSYEGFGGKVKADAALFAAPDELRWTILRPCCIAGKGKMPLDNLGGRRADFLTDILQDKVLDLPDGGSVPLQIVHVRDLARAFVLAAETPEAEYEVYHICGSHAVSLRRYCEINAEALGKEAKFASLSFDEMIAKYGEEIRGGLTFLVEPMCFSIAKAQLELGFEPEYSPEGAIRSAARDAVGLCE